MLFADTQFKRENVGDCLATVANEFCRPEQDLLALVAAELRRVVRGDLESLARMLGPARRHGPDHLVGVGIPHFDDVLGLDAPPADAHRLLDDRLFH